MMKEDMSEIQPRDGAVVIVLEPNGRDWNMQAFVNERMVAAASGRASTTLEYVEEIFQRVIEAKGSDPYTPTGDQ